MKGSLIRSIAAALWIGLNLSLRAADAPPGRPKIIAVLVDDMGFSDLGCYGSEIPTPNPDALAANGLHFTQFYNNEAFREALKRTDEFLVSLGYLSGKEDVAQFFAGK